MTQSVSTVSPGAFLTLHYRLSGPAGAVVNTFDDSPATLTLGTGVLSPQLEACLLGLAEGDSRTFEFAAGQVFGERNPQMLQWLKRQVIDEMSLDQEDLAVGEVLQFPTPDNQAHFAGVVRDFKDTDQGQAVLLDFNHPLAGQTVRFDVQIIGIL